MYSCRSSSRQLVVKLAVRIVAVVEIIAEIESVAVGCVDSETVIGAVRGNGVPSLFRSLCISSLGKGKNMSSSFYRQSG